MIPYLGTILLSLAIDNFRIRYVYYMQGSRFVVRYGRKGQGLIISSITRANRASFSIFLFLLIFLNVISIWHYSINYFHLHL